MSMAFWTTIRINCKLSIYHTILYLRLTKNPPAGCGFLNFTLTALNLSIANLCSHVVFAIDRAHCECFLLTWASLMPNSPSRKRLSIRKQKDGLAFLRKVKRVLLESNFRTAVQALLLFHLPRDLPGSHWHPLKTSSMLQHISPKA